MKAISGAFTILLFFFTISCASDNIHQPDPSLPGPDDLEIQGALTSSIPVFPDFPPIITDNTVWIEWEDNKATSATLILSEFSLYISVVDLHITIGTMVITDVVFDYDEEGIAYFEQPHFECQAGQYYTIGSITGTYDPKGKTIAFTIDYKPGSMPFMVKSEFYACDFSD